MFLDDGAPPHATNEVILGDKVTGRPNQSFDDLERAAAYGDSDPVPSQFALRKINLPLATFVYQTQVLRRRYFSLR
jgi:hypothetical protein